MDRQNPTKPFGKHARLIVREEEPFNAGPPPELLCQSFVTPTDLFFVRNHGSVPRIDPETYCLSITGMVNMPLKLSLDDLRRRFARKTVIATLQCAGHRRDELVRVSPV